SSNHESPRTNASVENVRNEPNFASSVDLSVPYRRVWNKAPISSLLEKMSSADVDAGKTITPNRNGNLTTNESANFEPIEDNLTKTAYSLIQYKKEKDDLMQQEDEIGVEVETTLQSMFSSLPNLNDLSGNKGWLLKEWVSMDSIFQRQLNLLAFNITRRTLSLEILCESLPEKDILSRRYSLENIPSLSLDPVTRAHVSSSNSSASTLTYAVVNSFATDAVQDFNQTTAKPQGLFNSRKYIIDQPPRQCIKRSHSEPSISNQA
ncbi:unnamed protein product, partial [Hymenolepis diminuta]